jgi:hypothetical protein
MKYFIITTALLVSLNALACGGGDKDKEDEEKDNRITSIR